MPREHQSQNYFLPMLPVRHYSITGNCSTRYKSLVPLQGIGITVPGSGITISKTAVRGVDSFGMLCSAHDIGWSDKADGVLVVMPDESQPGEACPADPPKVITTSLVTDASVCMHLTDKRSIINIHLHLHPQLASEVCYT